MSASKEFLTAFSKKNLKDIFYSSVKFKSAVGIDRVNSITFEKNLYQNISLIRKKVFSSTYNFSQYKEKLISKGANKFPRVISLPTTRDKLVLKALFRVIYASFPNNSPILHEVIRNINETLIIGKFDGFIRLDVKDFYPSIKHDLLLVQLSKKIKKKEILNLIQGSITKNTVNEPSKENRKINDKGIPQGLPISNILANIYMRPIDIKFGKRKSLAYFRYVDDILIFCNQKNIERIKQQVKDECKTIGLELHGEEEKEKCKSGVISSGFSFLGYEFCGNVISVRERSVIKFRNSFINYLTAYKYSKKPNKELLLWSINLRVTGCFFNERRFGWLFYFSQINDIQLLGRLDHFIENQVKKFGIPLQKGQLKSLIRAYYEITKNPNNSKYIPNFDNYSFVEKKNILESVFSIDTNHLQNSQIEYTFKKILFRSIRDLEKDLSRQS